jgi:hypothetical protein
MSEYRLVNPVVCGSVKTTVTAKNSKDAALKLWENLSENISGSVPQFGLTVCDGNNKLSHYSVTEHVGGKNKSVDFTIKKLDLKLKNNKDCVKNADKVLKDITSGQRGGKRHHRDRDEEEEDSSSTSTTEMLIDRRKIVPLSYYNYPVSYFYYDPIYPFNPFLPVFTVPSIPVVEVAVNSAFPKQIIISS